MVGTEKPSKKKMAWWKIGLITIVVGSIAYTQLMQQSKSSVAPKEPQATVPGAEFTKLQMGEAWPFEQIDSGVVECHEGNAVIFKANNGRTYALNGWGRTYSKTHGNPWNSIDEIHIKGKSIGLILDKGNELCK